MRYKLSTTIATTKLHELPICEWLQLKLGKMRVYSDWFIIGEGWMIVFTADGDKDHRPFVVNVDGRKLRGAKRTEFILRFIE